MQLVRLSRYWRAALLILLVVLSSPSTAQASDASDKPEPAPNYHAVYLQDDGLMPPAALDALASSIRAETEGKPSEIILLLHGYNTSFTLGRRQYREITKTIRKETRAQGWRPVVIGVHWPSHPGPALRWLPQMLGYRFLSAAGFPNAVSNPYFRKVDLASRTGKTGLRALLFRLNDEFPTSPIHALAHSMGGEMVVHALAPNGPSGEIIVEQPARELRLGMVVLAGADLDQDVFATRGPDALSNALGRARVWWITVPRRNTADAALELRRAAGRRDALGNRGLTLERAQFDALMARRGLVIDSGKVPIAHDITDYFTHQRLQGILASIQYLDRQETRMSRESVVATLDRILKADAGQLPTLPNVRSASARLYVRWRREPKRTDHGIVRIVTLDGDPAGPRDPGGQFPDDPRPPAVR